MGWKPRDLNAVDTIADWRPFLLASRKARLQEVPWALNPLDFRLIGAAEEMARLEKASAALRAMAAARAADCGAHRSAGFNDAEEWLAQLTGETRQTARSELATGSRLADCPKTKAAAADGELSLGQAEEITKTEREKPGSEGDLIDTAKSSSRQQLAEECRKHRHKGVNREALAAR